MKKRKDPTVSVAARISPEMKEKLESEAEDLEISLCQCASMYLALGFSSDGLKGLKHQLQDANDQIAMQQSEIKRLRQESIWLVEPYTSLLATIHRNDKLLEQFYKEYGKKPVQGQELKEAGFDFGALLAARQIGRHMFYVTGSFCWSFVDATQQLVYIRKRD